MFLHPASGSTDSRRHQVDEFVSAGFRVVTYDHRGALEPGARRRACGA
ncbi:hypothetical protein RAM_28405 [Amycolatopsis mediterranei S699]|uniref:Alpha/beta hydrolase n=1 Tax=Amycolatopsis mediterranei (strain S699) TaxID=713604 RepID=A0A9R0UAX6_AMYMS|nr:hypothetical protein RAM_28405 [Amycolatopsis mediterranei S699]